MFINESYDKAWVQNQYRITNMSLFILFPLKVVYICDLISFENWRPPTNGIYDVSTVVSDYFAKGIIAEEANI